MVSIAQICIPAAGGTFQEAQAMRTCLMNIENPLGDIAVNWELQTNILPQPILKEMDKLRLLIRS